MVATVTGDIPANQLGFTLMHEHIFSMSPGLLSNWPHVFDRDAEIENAIKVLDDAYDSGVRTVVDLTTIDLGRDPMLVREVAARTKVKIVMCTGVHLNPPRYLNRRTPERVVELFVRDISEGIATSGVKAGCIKVASGHVVSEQNIVHLRAAARAHKATGVPIMTHSEVDARTGDNQVAIFEEEGVDFSRVVIGHCGDSTDLAYLQGIMDRGATIGMDRFGSGAAATTQERIETIAELCRRGYADRMVLSHDTHCFSDAFPRELRRQRLPEWEFTMVSNIVLPGLDALGVDEADITALTVTNPARIFGG